MQTITAKKVQTQPKPVFSFHSQQPQWQHNRSVWRSHRDFLSCWHQPPVKLIIQMTHHTFSLIILTLSSLKESDKDLDCYWQIGKCSWCPCYVVWRQVKSTGGIKLRSSYWRFLFQCKQKRFMKLWNPILPGETCWHWFNMGHGSSVLDTLWLWLYMFLYFYKITNIFRFLSGSLQCVIYCTSRNEAVD